MKKTIRDNINAPYSLHDMNIIGFDINGNDMIMRSQTGLIRVAAPSAQVDGHVEFHDLDWDFCFVYLIDGAGHLGEFHGEKMMFRDFVERYPVFGFSIIDEVYGYNQTKYWGWFTSNRQFKECIIELYHAGDMVFVETEDDGNETV